MSNLEQRFKGQSFLRRKVNERALSVMVMAHVPSGVLENPPHVQWLRNGSVTIFRV
jgi:hypothetical protein